VTASSPAGGEAASEGEVPEGAPWYLHGVRFECTACGKCCHNHGDGFQYVFSTRDERKQMAQHLGLSLRRFEAEYCEKVAGRWSFISKGQACVFLEDGKCSVYTLRPKQCRTFPFWPELMESRDSWDEDVASFCPGVDQGPLHELSDIRTRLAEHGG
jgi:Fe-S-cluster containining protein